MLTQQHKKDLSGSANKTTISFSQKTKVTHTKKPQPLGNLQNNPRCEQHGKLGKMRVVKDLMKTKYGRLLFSCSDQSIPCSFRSKTTMPSRISVRNP